MGDNNDALLGLTHGLADGIYGVIVIGNENGS